MLDVERVVSVVYQETTQLLIETQLGADDVRAHVAVYPQLDESVAVMVWEPAVALTV